jgi:hypothetical protein
LEEKMRGSVNPTQRRKRTCGRKEQREVYQAYSLDNSKKA